MALSAEQTRHTENVFHIALRLHLGLLNVDTLKANFKPILKLRDCRKVEPCLQSYRHLTQDMPNLTPKRSCTSYKTVTELPEK